jgi:hypothetical protein
LAVYKLKLLLLQVVVAAVRHSLQVLVQAAAVRVGYRRLL